MSNGRWVLLGSTLYVAGCSVGAAGVPAQDAELSIATLDTFLAECGNGVCGSTEDCGRCPTDCGECPALLDAARPTVGDPVVVGAGDMGDCTSENDFKTAALLDAIPGTVFALGDNTYENGTTTEFNTCYEPTWGRHRLRTRPVVGNHEYTVPGAAGYFAYFGEAAGAPTQGWYSYDLGTWHIVALNSNCAEVGGCGLGSEQEAWLKADLAAHPNKCTMAIFHHPLFSSGQHGADENVKPLWDTLYEAGTDLILNGHEHDYERFAPQDPDGNVDRTYGIRELVLGMGGRKLRGFSGPAENSERRSSNTYGVMKLTLHNGSYSWEFVPVEGGDFEDAGTAACHDAPL